MKYLEFEIDKLTHSIEDVLTGKNFTTEILSLTRIDLRQIGKKNGWKFNWNKEFTNPDKEVFKLILLDEPDIIHGLVSFTVKSDHVYMDLIESAPFNIGKNKQYLGVAGNLVAFCCKRSFELGFDGEMAFTAKTRLIRHYEMTLGAISFGGQQMYIWTKAAIILVKKYFPDFFSNDIIK
jgi:hypothetical protein